MKRNQSFIRAGGLGVAVLGMLFSAAALAAPDIFYASSVTNVEVDGVAATTTNNLAVGGNNSATFDAAVFPAQGLELRVTWSIQNRAGPAGNTSYPKTVTFTSTTSVTPGPLVSLTINPTSCIATSAAFTCFTDVSFPAPATAGGYSVKVLASSAVGSGALQTRDFTINFTVEEPVEEKLDTVLTVNPDPLCVLLNAGSKNLMAKLEELVSTDPIPGKGIDFYVDPELDALGFPTASSVSVGSATTVSDGQATLAYDVNGLGVGDHTVYAEFDGDSGYYGSNDTGTLGIHYLFVGFQQPINPEGNSVFGNGRVIPIKIKIADANGNLVADATPTVWLTSYSAGTGLGEVLEPATSVSAADTDNFMRYVPEDGHYIYNWDLSSLGNGTYGVVVDLGENSVCSQVPYHAVITVAKKGKK